MWMVAVLLGLLDPSIQIMELAMAAHIQMLSTVGLTVMLLLQSMVLLQQREANPSLAWSSTDSNILHGLSILASLGASQCSWQGTYQGAGPFVVGHLLTSILSALLSRVAKALRHLEGDSFLLQGWMVLMRGVEMMNLGGLDVLLLLLLLFLGLEGGCRGLRVPDLVLHLNPEHVAVLLGIGEHRVVLVLQIGHVRAKLPSLEVGRQKFALEMYVVSLPTEG
jgi:hypothetical protein